MDEQLFKTLAVGLLHLSLFAAVYLYGRKSFPRLALWLSAGTFLVMMAISYYSIALSGISIICSLIYLRILRLPNQTKLFQNLYADHRVYATSNYSPAVLDLLGDKKWKYSEGYLNNSIGSNAKYFLWQGHTTSFVSAGQYTRTTVYNYYLAFVFPEGNACDSFKKLAAKIASRKHYTFYQKIKFFFSPDTETPCLAKTAADGSFVIMYATRPEAAYYERRLKWIKENVCKPNQSLLGPTFTERARTATRD